MWQLEPLLSSQPWKQKQKTQINVTSELWNKAQFWNPKKIGDRQINLNSNWWLVYRQLIFMSVHLDLSRIILSEKKGKRVDTCVLSVTVCLRSNILLRLQSKDHEEIQNECRVDVLRLWGGRVSFVSVISNSDWVAIQCLLHFTLQQLSTVLFFFFFIEKNTSEKNWQTKSKQK